MTTFRAQRTDGQGWVEGDLIHSFEATHIVESSYFKPSNDEHPTLIEIDPSTLQIKTTRGEWKPINEVEIL